MNLHRPLYLSPGLRSLEKSHAGEKLMQKAGAAIAEYIQTILPDVNSSILVVAGPGNNGGDALIAALHLRDIYQVTLVLCGDAEKLSADAADAYQQWIEPGGKVLYDIPREPGPIQWDIVVDGLFGIGLNKALEGRPAELVTQINSMGTSVLAIDIPSGLCADTGKVLGVAIRAEWTITFLGLKPGLFTLDGPDHAGEVILDNLGIEASDATGYLVEQEGVADLLPKRQKNSNKGNYGNVGVLGGAAQMSGAAVMSARAALLAGAGKVYAGLMAAHAPKFDAVMPELMMRTGEDVLQQEKMDCLVIGPGMGQSAQAKSLLMQAIEGKMPLVIDADALNLLANDENLRDLCRQREAIKIVTPHPGEAARMLACSVSQIQHDRLASVIRISREYEAITVLKGCGTVIATPDGRWYINHSGNPGLASAGMGDAMAGIIAALVAQGLSAEDATLLGVYLHGAAADALVQQGIGPVGMTASEVMTEARRLLNLWVEWKP